MGLLKLNPLMSTKRRRRRRQIGARNGSIALRAVTKGSSRRKHGEGSLEEYTWLPMDILLHIHSLMRVKDAARLACLSQDFTSSWRYRDNLIFSEESLGFNENMYQIDDKMRHFTSRVDKVMKAHKGIGVKTFKLDLGAIYNPKDFCHLHRIDRWLQIAVKPGIEELSLSLSQMNTNYNYPCSLFSGGTGDSLRCLELIGCSFYPTVESCCLRSLTRLKLWAVHILDDNLRCLFSTTALEWLELGNCSSLVCLEIPCLQHLSHLGVSFCIGLQLIENKAPNLSSFSLQIPVKQIPVKPGIEELNLSLSQMNTNYNYPCSPFSGGTGDSILCLDLIGCKFYPAVKSCCLRSLTRLKLWAVHILEDNLRCLFSTTFALEWLELGNCSSLVCLKIPYLQHLSHLGVSFFTGLQLIENKAPNLSSFSFFGGDGVQPSLGGTMQIKKFIRSCTNAALYARTEVPSYMPNLETLTIVSKKETVNTPMMASRFLHLKFLSITLLGRGYDFCNLISFIYTSPSLETFILSIP